MLPAPLSTDQTFFDNHDKVSRGLLWSLFGPDLLDCDWGVELDAELPELTPQSLLNGADIENGFSSMRLGFRFEELWHRALTSSAVPYVANLQITAPDSTLGELDLLIPRADHTLHLELALKFYLGTPNGWVGPNRRDRLDQKLAHTRSQQLTLPQRAAAQGILLTDIAPETVSTQRDIRSRALMRGCLFYPLADSTNARITLPEAVNPHHWRGYWCSISQLPACLDQKVDSRWYVLSRPEWMSPVLAGFSISAAELTDYLQLHFQHLSSSVCVARVEPKLKADQEQTHFWCEAERWMVVSDQWAAADDSDVS